MLRHGSGTSVLEEESGSAFAPPLNMAPDPKLTAGRAFVRSLNILLKFARLYGYDHARTAACRSYYSVLQARPGLPLQVIIAGRYHDAFAHVDGEWRFTDRLIFSDLVGDLSHHLRTNPL